MQSQLVDHRACCYHHVQMGQEESDHWEEENDNKIYRTDEWWEGQLKMNGMWNQTCGGLECQERLDLLKKFRHMERMEGKTAEETWAKELLRSEAEREELFKYEPSKFFKDTIESIRKQKSQEQ